MCEPAFRIAQISNYSMRPRNVPPNAGKEARCIELLPADPQFLLPSDPTISSAHLWHSDLHVANIFVDPTEPTKVVGVIDWQATEIAPLYFQANQPHIIDHDGSSITGLERPKLPEDIDDLEPGARQHATSLFLQQALCFAYNTLTHYNNPKLYAALQIQDTDKLMLLILARNLLVHGEASYIAKIAELESTWNEFDTSSPFPFSFTAKEKEEMEADAEDATRSMDTMRSIKEALGELFPEQGIVRHDQYDEALDALAQMKEQVIEMYAKNEAEKEVWEKMWPFET
jgi:hypothetical protein